ncbi:MAG TPA: DM9 repeat-containing protein, partial [Flavobacteriales bacterium]|nr:DM9 repeat-containing protein [Flavobacteriales bacterium]
MEKVMRLAASTLAGIVVCLASGLASAEGVDWVAKGSNNAALIPAGRDAQGVTLHLCRVNGDAGAVVLGKFWTAGADAWQCHVGTANKEQVFAEFDMLVQASKAEVTYKWVPGHATSYPQHSVVAGQVDKEGGRWLACAALNLADNSINPGYIFDENCV